MASRRILVSSSSNRSPLAVDRWPKRLFCTANGERPTANDSLGLAVEHSLPQRRFFRGRLRLFLRPRLRRGGGHGRLRLVRLDCLEGLVTSLLTGDALRIDLQVVVVCLKALVITPFHGKTMRVRKRVFLGNELRSLLRRNHTDRSGIGLHVNDSDRADQSRRENSDDRIRECRR